MSPTFNTETGELTGGDDLYTDVTDHITEPDRQQQEDRARREAIGTGKKPEPKPAEDGERAEGSRDTAQFGREEYERIRVAALADPLHPLNDARHPDHEATVEKYLRLGMMADGKDYDDEEANPVLGEVFEGGQIRELGADALSPAPRPALPEGFAFDEGALVLAETEAHAMGAPPALIMTVTDSLREVAEQAEARGVGWAPEDAEAELARRHGREGAARVVENARVAYQTLLESQHPLIVQRVRELGEGWGDDPGVITLFGTVLYEALRQGPITPAKEALLLRRAERERQADAAGRARAAKAADETPEDHIVSHGGRP
jgi:hypothetical protein